MMDSVQATHGTCTLSFCDICGHHGNKMVGHMVPVIFVYYTKCFLLNCCAGNRYYDICGNNEINLTNSFCLWTLDEEVKTECQILPVLPH